MEHIDILNRIVEAENEAQKMSREARDKRAALKDDLASERERIRSSYMERAKKRLSLVSDEEEKHTRETIEELDKRLDQDLKQVDELFSRNFESWVNKLVTQVIGA